MFKLITAVILFTSLGAQAQSGLEGQLLKNIEEFPGSEALYDGPNCHNSAFYMMKIYPYRIYTSMSQANFLYSSKSCTEVSGNNKAGTLVRFQNKVTGEDAHSVVSANKSSYIEKLKYTAQGSSYDIKSDYEVMRSLEVDSLCEQSGTCHNSKKYYQCNYGAKSLYAPKNSIEVQLDKVAKKVSDLTFESVISAADSSVLLRDTEALVNLVKSNNLSSWVSSSSEFWKNLLLDLNFQIHYMNGTYSQGAFYNNSQDVSKKLREDYNKISINLGETLIAVLRSQLKSGYEFSDNYYGEIINLLKLINAKSSSMVVLLSDLKQTSLLSVNHQVFEIIAGNTNVKFSSVDSYVTPFLLDINKIEYAPIAANYAAMALTELSTLFSNSTSAISNEFLLINTIVKTINNASDFSALAGFLGSVQYTEIKISDAGRAQLMGVVQSKLKEIRGY